MNLPKVDLLNKNRASINFIIFLLVIDLLTLSYYFVFKVNEKAENNLLIKIDREKTNSAYFVLPVKKDSTIKLVGRVQKIPVSIRDSKAEYSLVDKNHKKIVDIISTNQELELFAGLTVNITGKIIEKTISGVDLVDIKTISLK